MFSRRNLLVSLGAAAVPLRARIGSVDIGVCGPVDDFSKADQFGFDYFEPAVADVAALSRPQFADFERRVTRSRIKCECCNSFIRTLVVVGPQVDRGALTAYLNASLDRCRALGASIVVWGSASSRNVPDGFARERALGQIREFLKMVGDLAARRNIVIAIEPLRKQESNIINSGAEAFRLVREVNHPHVKMIIDYYHLREENENPEILVVAREAIVHLHFANPAGRVWPKNPAEDPGYAPFFALLKKTGFRGGLSIEGKGTFEADAAASMAFFRQELA